VGERIGTFQNCTKSETATTFMNWVNLCSVEQSVNLNTSVRKETQF